MSNTFPYFQKVAGNIPVYNNVTLVSQGPFATQASYYPNFTVEQALLTGNSFGSLSVGVNLYFLRANVRNYQIAPPYAFQGLNGFANIYLAVAQGAPSTENWAPYSIVVGQTDFNSQGSSLNIGEVAVIPKTIPTLPLATFNAQSLDTRYLLDSYIAVDPDEYTPVALPAWYTSAPAWEFVLTSKEATPPEPILHYWDMTFEAVNATNGPGSAGTYICMISLPFFDSATYEVSVYGFGNTPPTIDGLWMVSLSKSGPSTLSPTYVGADTAAGDIKTVRGTAPFVDKTAGAMLVIKYTAAGAIASGSGIVATLKARPSQAGYTLQSNSFSKP